MQYNVEECYERLKNGFDESADMSDFDSLVYNSQIFDGDKSTNAHEGRSLSTQDQPWPTQGYEMSPSHFHASGWQPDTQQQQELPYPADDPYDLSRPAPDIQGTKVDIYLIPPQLDVLSL